MNWRILLFYLGVGLVFSVPNILILRKENHLKTGKSIFLALAPRDPRSLMQGDYMAIAYHIPSSILYKFNEKRGFLVVTLDERNIASPSRILSSGEIIKPNEAAIAFRHDRDLRIGAESFFFQEGHDKDFVDAKFGELVLDSHGVALLKSLRGENLEPLPKK